MDNMTPDHKIPEECGMKPLFIPLKSEYYEAFASGKKTVEYRVDGPRWNEGTCYIGRPVILSKGYGTQNRLGGIINNVEIKQANHLDMQTRIALDRLYGHNSHGLMIICIHISDIKPVVQP